MHASLIITSSLLSIATAKGHWGDMKHAKRQPTARHHRRTTDPSNLSSGSLTSAEGCTQFYTAVSGDVCNDVVSKFSIDSLSDFYSWNPQLDNECSNLWAGSAYCVAKGSSPANNVAVTTTAPAASSTSSDDDDDWVCDSDDETTTPAATTTQAARKAYATTTSAAAVQTTTQKAQATTTTSTQAAAQTTAASTNKNAVTSSSVQEFISNLGVRFPVSNGPAIGSWYEADSSQDSTNGHSWCYFPYTDDTPGIAISLATMTDNGALSNEEAGNIYCGLEVEITNPDGTTANGVVADAFDDAWIRETGSIDIMHGLFTQLYGSYTDNKDDVIEGVTWRFTGGRNDQYKFNGQGN